MGKMNIYFIQIQVIARLIIIIIINCGHSWTFWIGLFTYLFKKFATFYHGPADWPFQFRVTRLLAMKMLCSSEPLHC